MTTTKFRNLSMSIQSSYLWISGEYLGKIDDNSTTFILYALYGFFVEVEFAPDSDQVENIKILDADQVIKKYLNQITLPEKLIV